MSSFTRFFKNLFKRTPSKELVCLADETTGEYFCYEVKQGAYIKIPGGPYTLTECEQRIAEG